jgi:hypothetical protein
MRKSIISLFFIALGISQIKAQVGIQTENPQTTFHIDAAKDNPVTGAPDATQQANDIAVNSAGNVGVGTTTPSTKLDIVSSTAGALKITDGTQGNGKILVSDANGVATWQNSSPAVIITSTTGNAVTLPNSGNFVWLGSQATVTIPGYYMISPRLITDSAPAGCSNFVAYNLSTSTTSVVNAAFPLQDAHFASGPNNNFVYSTNVAYLNAGTYYMLIRCGTNSACTSNVSRSTASQNSFTLTLLK